MKSLLIIAFACFMALCSAEDLIKDSFDARWGQSCLDNPIFTVTALDIDPWPITISTTLTITLTGVFLQYTDVYSLRITNRFNDEYATVSNYYVYRSYPGQTSVSFIGTTQSGNWPGFYQQELVLLDMNFKILTCWMVSYVF